MNKQYEAYYSPKWARLWLVLFIIFTIGALFITFLFSTFESIAILIMISIAFIVCDFSFFLMFFKTKSKTGVAVEIKDDVLILHKKESISIPLKEIKRIDIHDGYGSFDIIVKTAEKKVSLHCFIQNEREKKKLLIDILKNIGINVSTYNLS